MKKICKFLSFTLAVIMTFVVTPFSTSAATARWEDGTLLAKKLNLFDAEFETNVSSGIKENNNRYVAQDRALTLKVGETTDTLVATSDINMSYKVMCGGISTDLPVNDTAKYTIRMDLNLCKTKNLYIGLVGDTYETMQGIYMEKNNNLPSNVYNITEFAATKAYAMSDPTNRVKIKDEEFHEIAIVIDGYTATLFIDGMETRTMDYTTIRDPNNANYKNVPTKWTGQTLNFAIGACQGVSNQGYSNGDEIIKVKNVEIFAGMVTSRSANITFEGTDGKVLKTITFNQDSYTLTDSDFPTITDVPAGKVVKWFLKDDRGVTSIVINAPHQVPCDPDVIPNYTVVARFVNDAPISVVGIQYTNATSDNTQSIRFLAALHTLQAESTGFIVTAKYKDNVGQLQKKEFTVTSTRVYTSITATENGTMKSVTAAELGGTYLVALSFDDVPTNIGQIDFEVTAFLKVSGEKTVNSNMAAFSVKDAVVYTGSALQ